MVHPATILAGADGGSSKSYRPNPVDSAMDLPSIKRLIVRERDREKKEKRRKISSMQTSQWCLQTALCIAAALQGDVTAAAEWLCSPHRRGRQLGDSIDHDAAKTELKNLYDATPADEMVLWPSVAVSPLPPSSVATALKWSQEYKLKVHVRKANVECGAPVRSVGLIEQYNATIVHDGLTTVVPQVESLEWSRGKQWCYRWRTRQGGASACLGTREPVPLEVKRQQASGRDGAGQLNKELRRQTKPCCSSSHFLP